MPTFVSLLRGVNVSGKRPLPMADLAGLCERLGFEKIRTYLQSGNVVFCAKAAAEAARLGPAICGELQADVPVLTLSARTFRAIVEANPLVGKPGIDPAFLHATLLFGPVKAAPADPPASGGEQMAFVKGHLFLYCPHGYGRTKLNNAYFERRLKVPATTRNWKTMLALAEMAAARAP